MKELIEQAIRDVKNNRYSRQDAMNLYAELRLSAEQETEELVNSGNVMLRRIYFEALDELNHYVRQIPVKPTF